MNKYELALVLSPALDEEGQSSRGSKGTGYTGKIRCKNRKG